MDEYSLAKLVADNYGLKFASEIKPISYLSDSITWNKDGAISSLFTGMAQVGLTVVIILNN